MDLVALGSWLQINSGQRSWQHFLAVFSPGATWIAYGKRVEHRRVCFEMYQRWDGLAKGQFMAGNRDVYLLAILLVLLDSQATHLDKIASVLGSSSCEILDLTRMSCMTVSRPLQGLLQFLPQCIEGTPSLEWRSYSSRLCQQLMIVAPLVAPGKITIKTVFDAILKKEQRIQLEAGPFSTSDPLVLCAALSQLCDDAPTKITESALSQLIASLNSASEQAFHYCLQTITSRPQFSHQILYTVSKDLEYVATDSRVLRLVCECICRHPDTSTTPIFCPSGPIPDTARPLYAVFLWAVLMARRPILNMSGWLRWVLQGEQDALVRKFELAYEEVCGGKPVSIDFSMAFQHGVDGAVERLVKCLRRMVGEVDRNEFIASCIL